MLAIGTVRFNLNVFAGSNASITIHEFKWDSEYIIFIIINRNTILYYNLIREERFQFEFLLSLKIFRTHTMKQSFFKKVKLRLNNFYLF